MAGSPLRNTRLPYLPSIVPGADFTASSSKSFRYDLVLTRCFETVDEHCSYIPHPSSVYMSESRLIPYLHSIEQRIPCKKPHHIFQVTANRPSPILNSSSTFLCLPKERQTSRPFSYLPRISLHYGSLKGQDPAIEGSQHRQHHRKCHSHQLQQPGHPHEIHP
jgi:hypothetical protein